MYWIYAYLFDWFSKAWTNALQLALRALFPSASLFFCQPSPQGPSGEKGPIGLSLGMRGRRSPTLRGWFSWTSGTRAPSESMTGALKVLEPCTWTGAGRRSGGVRSVCLRVSKDVYMCRKRLAPGCVLRLVSGAWHLCKGFSFLARLIALVGAV